MNPEAQAILQEILQKDAEALTPHEIAFLNARSSYLNNRQRAEFASVLRPENAKPVEAPVLPQNDTPTQFTNPEEAKQPGVAKPVDPENAYAATEGYDEEV